MTPRSFAAADLGASSGRVILGTLTSGRFQLHEVSRWDNGPAAGAGPSLHWDFPMLADEVRRGFEAADSATDGALESVGIDTWGVDYGRLDGDDRLLELPFHYRDARTDGVPDRLFRVLPEDRLYGLAGLQTAQFNTIFQLVAAAEDPRWAEVHRLLFMPDLLAHSLTGRHAAEMTIASTSGLLDVATRGWAAETCEGLARHFGLPVPRVLPELVEPGTILGATLPGVLAREIPLVSVGSHDTASAVASVPATDQNFAFISSGTWSLVGVELDQPVLTQESSRANFTNELGVDSTVRYLRNVMGLWVLQECRREWAERGVGLGWGDIVGLAEAEPPLRCVLDMNDERLLHPGDMLGRLRRMAAESGQELAEEPGAISRCVIDSLALAYRDAVRTAARLSGRQVDVIHVIGGGSQNRLLCQLAAEAAGLPVVAGPAEGTALGNLLVQARACGALSGDLMDLRRVSRASSDLTTYHPGVLPIPASRWDEAAGIAQS